MSTVDGKFTHADTKAHDQRDAERAVGACRHVLAASAPHLVHLLSAYPVRVYPQRPWVGRTDGRCIELGGGWLALSAGEPRALRRNETEPLGREREYVLVHELLHAALAQPARAWAMRERAGRPYLPKIMNVVADAIVNETIDGWEPRAAERPADAIGHEHLLALADALADEAQCPVPDVVCEELGANSMERWHDELARLVEQAKSRKTQARRNDEDVREESSDEDPGAAGQSTGGDRTADETGGTSTATTQGASEGEAGEPSDENGRTAGQDANEEGAGEPSDEDEGATGQDADEDRTGSEGGAGEPSDEDEGATGQDADEDRTGGEGGAGGSSDESPETTTQGTDEGRAGGEAGEPSGEDQGGTRRGTGEDQTREPSDEGSPGATEHGEGRTQGTAEPDDEDDAPASPLRPEQADRARWSRDFAASLVAGKQQEGDVTLPEYEGPGEASRELGKAREVLARAVRSPGSLPGRMASALAETRANALPWQERLRPFFERVAANEWVRTPPRTQPGRPSRQTLAAHAAGLATFYAERTVTTRPAPRCAVCVDTSGSVDTQLLGAFATHVLRLATRVEAAVHLVAGDVEVCAELVATDESATRLRDWIRTRMGTGRGGTNFGPLIAHALEHEANLIVYLTDGWATLPARPNVPVVWAVPAGARDARSFEWGHVITI